MGKILVFGHKNPDTDSITSSLVMANLERKLGKDAEACRLGNINKETEYVLNYLGLEAPCLIEDVEDGQEVILVDHANFDESVPNLKNAQILKVVDHHRVGLETSYPLYYRAEPVGCTETVMYKLYKENEVEIDKTIATLMLSAIISDTLLLKSPTCTEEDRNAVKELAKIAELDYESYGLDMLKAGTDLSSFSIEEILNLDAKQTSLKNVKAIINQVNTASIPEVMKMKADLEAGMNKIIEEKELDLFMLLITDIVNSNSQVIALGKSASLVEKSYGVKLEDNTALLEGVVSRKKQVIPVMTENA
jgi:manganese-dependent inorganic pyrophosphatase